ncbi:hypothetical protein BD311DRAFT_763004 [Dichomitus squalens]|uniref:Uncharacterized protein n=1 Tax=Dichomitus squalens TaxID=114155 RepID=A0A4Q9MHS9_9APHY|nr:hypothetical protein BD311DRAFT_763004 [Dichomitus squalens]
MGSVRRDAVHVKHARLAGRRPLAGAARTLPPYSWTVTIFIPSSASALDLRAFLCKCLAFSAQPASCPPQRCYHTSHRYTGTMQDKDS